jgi:hypothetical protein
MDGSDRAAAASPIAKIIAPRIHAADVNKLFLPAASAKVPNITRPRPGANRTPRPDRSRACARCRCLNLET